LAAGALETLEVTAAFGGAAFGGAAFGGAAFGGAVFLGAGLEDAFFATAFFATTEEALGADFGLELPIGILEYDNTAHRRR
jgi:hypothetical protein